MDAGRQAVSWLLPGVLALACVVAATFGGPAGEGQAPALVLVVIIDGLGQDQVERLSGQAGKGGFRRLLQGAWFSEAHYGYAATFTASGHATVPTGSFPNRHGLVGNEWTDPSTGNRIYCVGDSEYPVLDSRGEWGVSPVHLKVPTVGDQLLEKHSGRSRVVAISMKDRGAVLPAGHSGTAFFYNATNGRFVTSSYYLKEYPAWWRTFYDGKSPQDRWFGRAWDPLRGAKTYTGSAPTGREIHIDVAGLGKSFPHRLGVGELAPGPMYYIALTRTPFGHDYTLEFLKAAVRGQNLGRNPSGEPDLLFVSFSSHDYINHGYGSESTESHDAFLRLDRTLSDLLRFVDKSVGLRRTLVALTSDHGFAESPEWMRSRGEDAGRVDVVQMMEDLNGHLSRRFGPGKYVLSWYNPTVFLNRPWLMEKGLDSAEVEDTAAEFVGQFPGIGRVFTRHQLKSGKLPQDDLSERVLRSWKEDVSGDLFVVQKRGWYLLGNPAANCATHGSPYEYDTNVPLVFLGPWFKPGRYDQRVDVTDLAPTLAAVLGVPMPESCEGRVLSEILLHP